MTQLLTTSLCVVRYLVYSFVVLDCHNTSIACFVRHRRLFISFHLYVMTNTEYNAYHSDSTGFHL